MELLERYGRAILAAAAGVILIGGLIGAARSDPPGGGGTASGYAPLITATPAPSATAEVLPGGASAGSALVMIQGLVDHRLVILPLAGGAPQEVDQHVNLWPLLPDPTGTRVLYGAGGSLMVLDVRARRAAILSDLPDGSSFATAQWSPDGSALAYVISTADEETAYYVPADGRHPAVAMLSAPGGLPVDVAWLSDGRPLTIYLGLAEVGGLEARYQVYDPATQERYLLPPDVRPLQPWAPWRSPDGTQQLYTLSTWDKTRRSGACKTGPLGLAGQEWVYLSSQGGGKQRKIAFEVHNVFFDRVTWLHDGRILLRGISDEACAPAKSGLYLARLGEEPRQIIQAASPFVNDDPDLTPWGLSYAVSPDQTFIAWSENDLAAGRSSIRLRPLDGGSARTLFKTAPPPGDATPYAFEDQDLILYFVWLP